MSSLVMPENDFWGALPSHLHPEGDLPYLSDNYVVLDFEIDTSHGDYGHPVHPKNQMLLACWKRGMFPQVMAQWGGEYGMAQLQRDIEAADFLVCHNAKYELGWLKRCGLDISKVLVFDTKLGEYVLGGNRTSNGWLRTSLNDCCVRRGWKQKDPVVDHLIKDGVNPVFIPRAWLQGRCEQDVRDTERLMLSQREELLRRKQLQVLYTRCLLTPVLADIELAGMQLDPDRVMEEHAAWSKKLVEAERELQEIAPINWNSDKQKGEFIYGELGFTEKTNKKGEPIRTKGGQPRTDSDTLLSLGGKTAEQKRFLKAYRNYNQAEAFLTKNLEFFKLACERHGGRIHAEFNQGNTATHRLSSSGIPIEGKKAQFQNLPNQFKRLFKARHEDWYFCEWDGSGLEFRAAGLISGDKLICQDINEGRDPHAFSGSVINGITYDEFIERKQAKDEKVLTWRKKAKVHTFKPLYGGQSGSAAEKRYYKAFQERYAGLTHCQEQWLMSVLGDKHLRTPWGLTFYFPDAKVESDGYVNVRTKVFNYPIQAIATAEMIPLAAVYFYHRVRSLGLEDFIVMVNTVHDSVLCEVHPDFLDDYKAIARECWLYVYWYFENVYGFPLQGLPLGTEITWGTHWSEGQEEAWNIYDDGRMERT